MPERIIPVKRKDPVTTFLFAFKITSGPLALDYKEGTAYFRSASGLKVQQDVQDYPEGGISTFTRKLVGGFKWPNIVLSQGFTGDKRLFAFKNTPKRINGQILQLGAKLDPVCRWEFFNGRIVKWSGAEYDATKNEVAIETIEIAHEGLVMNPEVAPPPAPPAPPPPKPPEPKVDAKVNFPTNSKAVAASPDLDAVADNVKKSPDKKIKIEGHTDNVGDHGYNMTLSQQRADAVKQYLVGKGVPDTQISVCKGYGPDQPIASNDSAAGRSQNRRTTVNEEA
jgi:phage tail-like protein